MHEDVLIDDVFFIIYCYCAITCSFISNNVFDSCWLL